MTTSLKVEKVSLKKLNHQIHNMCMCTCAVSAIRFIGRQISKKLYPKYAQEYEYIRMDI